jgi:hypothetical protein
MKSWAAPQKCSQYTQQADNWQRLNKVDEPKWWLWRKSTEPLAEKPVRPAKSA